ncbi:hypothetical protein TWF106_000716 [Orbilia oligospora]|uniref:MAGE domain-containing protein n=1 Tax=Orbilia oligospora TaxID=2813651 RepID=A0A6G1MH07_ORBOL|nr:hypothetical protein TWF106_000716 [Orbilia oligospora]KAF3212519.1 hypothetical protein TWF679_005710 [Orbilia oligospora]KAF3258194.1 hypothetical protein TWF192_000330 [Orbilia oligospora]
MARTPQETTRKRPRKSQREPTREPTPEEVEEEEEEEEEEDEEDEEPQQPARRRQTYSKQPKSRHSRRETEVAEPNDASGLRARRKGGAAAAGRRASKRRRSEEEEEEEEEEEGAGEEEEEEEEGSRPGDKGLAPVSKLVRLALAMEYQKKPIRRQDITEKVLGPKFKGDFKIVFQEAQDALKNIFGFEMVELPAITERISLAQQRRQAAADAQRGDSNAGSTAAEQKRKKEASSSKSWQLVSILPDQYRLPILMSPQLPDDQTILGIGSAIVTLVYLSGRSVGEKVLLRHLRKFGVEDRIPVEGNRENGKMENIMGKLIREGYLVKLKDEVVPGQEQTYTYVVGPRGKLEVGREGATRFVKKIYEGVDGEVDEAFERKINRALGKEEGQNGGKGGGEEVEEAGGSGRRNEGRTRGGGSGKGRGGGRPGRRRRDDSEEDEEEEEEAGSDEDSE